MTRSSRSSALISKSSCPRTEPGMAVGKRQVLVFDAGPLISFACARGLDALASWVRGKDTQWPRAVRDEVERKSRQAGYERAAAAVDPEWLPDAVLLDTQEDLRSIEEIRYRFASAGESHAAHAGEAAAIHLAKKLEATGTPTLLTGDFEAGVVAKATFGLRRLMTRDLLVVLVAEDMLEPVQAWTLFERMQDYSRLPEMDRAPFLRLCRSVASGTSSS